MEIFATSLARGPVVSWISVCYIPLNAGALISAAMVPCCSNRDFQDDQIIVLHPPRGVSLVPLQDREEMVPCHEIQYCASECGDVWVCGLCIAVLVMMHLEFNRALCPTQFARLSLTLKQL